MDTKTNTMQSMQNWVDILCLVWAVLQDFLHWVELLFQRGAFPHCNRVRLPRHLFAHLWHSRRRQKVKLKLRKYGIKFSLFQFISTRSRPDIERVQWPGWGYKGLASRRTAPPSIPLVFQVSCKSQFFCEFGIQLHADHRFEPIIARWTCLIDLTSLIHYMDRLRRLFAGLLGNIRIIGFAGPGLREEFKNPETGNTQSV